MDTPEKERGRETGRERRDTHRYREQAGRENTHTHTHTHTGVTDREYQESKTEREKDTTPQERDLVKSNQ